jgi:hypothetical protein
MGPSTPSSPLVRRLARDHRLPESAVAALLEALRAGQGRMAQFDIPALGGAGQWMSGGMTMVGGRFSPELKAKVDALCRALQAEAAKPGPAAARAGAEAPPESRAPWWPAAYSAPAATGGQDGLRYAYFPQDDALVVEQKGRVVVYDTAGRDLQGFGQSQPGAGALSLRGRRGGVDLAALPRKAAPRGRPGRATTSGTGR